MQILLNFRTAYFNSDNELVVSRSKIVKRYLTRWFTVDVLSVLPYEALLTSDSFGLVRLLKGARVRPRQATNPGTVGARHLSLLLGAAVIVTQLQP
jgi:hypothetical protein